MPIHVAFQRMWRSKNGHKAERHQGVACTYAFTEGVDYYTFAQSFEIPEMRMRIAQRFLEEMQINCDKEYLTDYTDAILACLNPKDGESIRLDKVAILTNELKKRLEWIFEPDTLYRFATVMYFDLKEDIKQYDPSYQKKKLERFKKKGLKYFLKELTENSEKLLNLSDSDFKTYIKELQQRKDEQSTLIHSLKDSKP